VFACKFDVMTSSFVGVHVMLVSCAVIATSQYQLQGITAVIKELHAKFPMVDYHDGTMLLAVGSARPAGHATPSQVQDRLVHRRCHTWSVVQLHMMTHSGQPVISMTQLVPELDDSGVCIVQTLHSLRCVQECCVLPQAHHTSGHHAGLAELPHAAADEEPVAVFDMRSGTKTRVLHFGCVTLRHAFDTYKSIEGIQAYQTYYSLLAT